MEFRMLGPLQIEDEGHVLPLRGPRIRALLAALLVSANEVVADTQLLDELWEDAPPASGAAALRVRVSQLRKLLGDGIVTRAPGYMLVVEPESIDAHRFEGMLRRARNLRARDPAGAASLLTEALALWRGPALADVGSQLFVRREAARLGELRLTATELRIDAELALGRHDELVPELESLVGRWPLRERLREQLMLALYRSGSQVRALTAYRDGRARLVDDYGIEPGAALRDLEAAILRQDPALSLGGAVDVPAGERKLVTALAVVGGRDDVAAEIEAAGARIEERSGAALVGVFGAPLAQEDHANRALRTALDLRGRHAGIRVGIESEEIITGGVEGGAQAKRLALRAKPGTILAGERAIATASRTFEFAAPSTRSGRALLCELATAPTRGVFVGREQELERLLSGFRAAVRDGTPRLLTITGNAGVGKTRIAAEFCDRLAADDPRPLWLTGRCLAHGRGFTYRPLADVLRQRFGLLETDAPEAIRARLAGRDVLGLALGLDAPPELHPLTARDRLQAASASFLGELAAEQPLVVLVEDLHWAHDPLLDLLERVLDDVAGPLVLVCTARPELAETRPWWGRRRDADSVWLEPLGAPEAEELLARHDVTIPDTLRARVLERAEGNPFFLEELASSIAERSTPLEVPDSIQAVLASRIDLLPPLEKAALQAAAVIGRSFWPGAIRALLGDAAPDFTLLEARDFVRRLPTSTLAGEREYAFKHALTRDVAYATLSDERRARLHASFAGWLEDSGGGRDEHAALLAHHYAEAAELEHLEEKACTWLRRAAELAIGRYELEEALALLDRALELADSPADRLSLYRLIGRANALRHHGAPFLEAMTSAIGLSPDRAASAELYAELAFETALRAGMWRKRPERELVDGWIDRALALAEPGSPSRARALIARCVWAPSGNGEAAREAGVIAEALGDAELRSYALDAQGITAWVDGDRDAGRAFEARRFDLLDRIHDPDHMADINYAPVSGCVWLGDFEEARRLAGRHDEITRELTAHHRVHGVAVLVEVEELTGSWARIRDELEPRAASSILANLETPCVRSPRSLYVMAIARHVLGDPEGARQLEEVADEFGMEGYGHVLETPRLHLALLREELETVERLVSTPLPDRGWHRGWMLLSTEAIRLDALAVLGRGAEVEAWLPERPGTYVEPFWLRALGRVREDEALIEKALACFERLGLPWFAEQTRAALRV